MFVGVWYDYLYRFVDDVIFDYFVDKGGKNNVVVVRRRRVDSRRRWSGVAGR